MTPREIDIIRTSFGKVLPIKDTAGALFYEELFRIDPDMKTMFKGDIREQGRKLIDTLAIAVSSLRTPEQLNAILASLGERHARHYEVKREHYGPVGTALMITLRKGLGASFTAEVEATWKKLYKVVSQAMIDAASRR